MTATKDYLKSVIAEAANKGVGLSVSDVRVEETKVVVELAINGEAEQSPFWRAVLEQWSSDD